MNETNDEKDDDLSSAKKLKETTTEESEVNGNKMTSLLNEKFYNWHPRWRSCFIRGISCTSMNLFVIVVIYYGNLSVILMVWLLVFKAYQEILNLNLCLRSANEYLKKCLNRLSLSFAVLFFYIFFGNGIIKYFRAPLSENAVIQVLMKNHPLISAILYLLVIGYFLSLLKPENYQAMYSHLGWIHCAALYIFLGYLQVDLTFQGVIWTYYPVMLIVSNDIFAYLFGFFIGQTPLVKLSPKKTWEGYLGAMLPTIFIGAILSQIFVRFDHFVCPLEYRDNALMSANCDRNPVFNSITYNVSSIVSDNSFLPNSISLFPTFFLHGLVLSVFAAVFAPITTGFLASGLKRSFNVKDFDNLIPGHGGILDRVDCQTAMSLFTWGYYYSLIHLQTENQLLQMVTSLSRSEQLKLFSLFQNMSS